MTWKKPLDIGTGETEAQMILKVFSKIPKEFWEELLREETKMDYKERLELIEKNAEETSKTIQELKKELEKPGIDWCVGMWVENICTGEKAFIRNITSCFGCGELYGCYLISLQRDIGWVNKNQLKDWTPIPYPYQEFLKVGDRVKMGNREGTIMGIDGDYASILVLWDGYGSGSWYNPHQIAKIGGVK